MKKNNKRMLVAVLAMAMALSMTACSQEPGDEPSSSEPESSVSEQASEPESSDPEAEEEPGSDAEAEAETETSEPAAEEPGSGADTGSSAASQPATDTTTSQPAANQSGSQAGASGQAPAAQTQQPAANSQSQAPASQNQSQSTSTPPATTQTSNASSGKGPLANYTVSVQDNSTPAVSVSGRSIDGKSSYYFYSADDDILGYIASNVVSQINRDYKMIQKTDEEHKAWYVEQFNELRGVEGSSGSTSSGSSDSNSSSSGSTGSGSSEIDIDEYKNEVLRLVNEERENAGLPDLVPHSTAMEFAQIRAEEISELFSHKRPDGTFGVYSHYHFGENIAKGQETPQEVVDDWMSSNTHRSAIMDTVSNSNNTIGIGVYQDDGGTLYWVLEFVTWDAEG